MSVEKTEFGRKNKTLEPIKLFVNRDFEKEIFLKRLNVDNQKVLMYFGVAGIGKSELRKKLETLYNQMHIKNVVFKVDLKDNKSRDISGILLNFVKSCNNKKFKFKYFELAFAIYFKMKYPAHSFETNNKSILDNSGSVITDIISIFDKGVVATSINIGSLISKKLTNSKIPKDIKDALIELTDLPIAEAEEKLLDFFIYDIDLDQKNSNERIVFFIDSLESLTEHQTSNIKSHINERCIELILDYLIDDYLVVVFGRDKINWGIEWSQRIDTFELRNLKEKYSKELLINSGVQESKIVDKIVDSCNGYPLYLKCSVDTYRSIINNQIIPKIEDFGSTHKEILSRFISNINELDLEIFKVMSIPRYFTREIFVYLLDKTNIGSPMSKLDMLESYSLIKISDNNVNFYLDDMFKKSLDNHINIKMRIQIHNYMIDYYSKFIHDIGTSEKFIELVYHNINLNNKDYFKNWLKKIDVDAIFEQMQVSGEQLRLNDIFECIVNKYDINVFSPKIFSKYIDTIHLGGDYQTAVAISSNYLENFKIEEIVLNDYLFMMKIRIYHNSMFFKPVDILLEKALNLYYFSQNTTFKKEYNELLFLIGGNLGVLRGNFEFAREWLDRSHSFSQEHNLINFETRYARKYVDILIYNEEYAEAENILEKFVNIHQEKYTRYEMYLLGSFGELFRKKGEMIKAKEYFNLLEKLSEEKNIVGWKAHGLLGQAFIEYYNDNFENSLELNKEAYNIYYTINQEWGIINSNFLKILLNKKYKIVDNLLNDNTLNKVKEMGYGYHAKYIEDFNNDIEKYFQLFFL